VARQGPETSAPAPRRPGAKTVAVAAAKPAATSAERCAASSACSQDANEACVAAHEAFLQLQKKGVAARRKIEEIVKALAEKNAEEWGKIEFEETKIGRLDHKIEKLQIIKLVPGVDWLRPDARSGDHGITLEEYTPFGVVGAVTPSTHSIPTLSGNIVNICAAGNAVVFNAHPERGQVRRGGGARLQRGDLSRDRHREHRASSRSRRWIPSTRCASTKHVRLLLVTGGPDGREGRDANRQARHLRRPGQSPGAMSTTPLHEARGEGDHPGRELRQQPALHRREGSVRARKHRGQVDGGDGARTAR
jgi:hypothetical protein